MAPPEAVVDAQRRDDHDAIRDRPIDEVRVGDVGQAAAGHDHQRAVGKAEARGRVDDQARALPNRFGAVSSIWPLAGRTSGAPMLAVGSGMLRRPLARAAATSPRQPAMFASRSVPGRARVHDDPGERRSAAVRQQARRTRLASCRRAPSFRSTIGLRSSTGRRPWGTLEPRSRLSVQPIATRASASATVFFSLQNRAMAAVGGMIARVPSCLSAFVTAALLAAACQPGAGTAARRAAAERAARAGASGARAAAAVRRAPRARPARRARRVPAAARGAGGSGSGGAAGTSGAAGTTGGAGTGGSTGNGGRGGSGAGGNAGAAGAGGRGGSTRKRRPRRGRPGRAGVTCTTPPPTGASYAIDATGVTFTLNPGRMRVQVCKDDIIRVQYTSGVVDPEQDVAVGQRDLGHADLLRDGGGRRSDHHDRAHEGEGHREQRPRQLHGSERHRAHLRVQQEPHRRRPSRASPPTPSPPRSTRRATKRCSASASSRTACINRKGIDAAHAQREHADP